MRGTRGAVWKIISESEWQWTNIGNQKRNGIMIVGESTRKVVVLCVLEGQRVLFVILCEKVIAGDCNDGETIRLSEVTHHYQTVTRS